MQEKIPLKSSIFDLTEYAPGATAPSQTFSESYFHEQHFLGDMRFSRTI